MILKLCARSVRTVRFARFVRFAGWPRPVAGQSHSRGREGSPECGLYSWRRNGFVVQSTVVQCSVVYCRIE